MEVLCLLDMAALTRKTRTCKQAARQTCLLSLLCQDTCELEDSLNITPVKSSFVILNPSRCSNTSSTDMRVSQIAAALLLPLAALAARKSSSDRFNDFHAKQVSASGAIKLDDSSYSQLTAAPRNYSTAVLLTALDPRFGCGLCHDFQPEWEILARSWTKGDKKAESKLVFGTLDFVDGKGTFQSVRKRRFRVLRIIADG